MYTVPFYTNSESLEQIASSWAAGPLFTLNVVGNPALFWTNIVSEQPPVVFVGLDSVLLAEAYISRLRLNPSGGRYQPHVVAVTESTADHIVAAAFAG